MSGTASNPARPALPDATLPARLRLKTQREFRVVYQRGGRAGGAWLTVVAWPRHDPAPGGPRVGLSVSKDHGGAVRRNKLKRILREAFRLERHRLPALLDVVLIPKVRLTDRLPLAEVRAELLHLIPRAMGRPPRHRAGDKPKRSGKGERNSGSSGSGSGSGSEQ